MEQKKFKRHAIAEILADRIRKGVYKGYSKLPSRKNLAIEFNAHMNTLKEAFRLLREQGLIENKPGDCVTIKSKLLRNLKLALILPAGYGNFDIVNGIKESMQGCDFSLEILLYSTSEEQSQFLKKVKEKSFSGIIIRPDFSGNGYHLIHELENEKLPVVILDNFYQDSDGWHIDPGFMDVAIAALKYAQRTSRLPLGIVTQNDRFGNAFKDAYIEAHRQLKENPYRLHIKLLETCQTPANAALELIKLENPPWSIFFTDSQGAVEAYKAFKEEKKNLKDIKLISFGENIHSELFEYPIFSTKRDFKELGLVAGKLVLRQIKEAPNQCNRYNEKLKIELKI